MVKGKRLTDFTNLFSRKKIKKTTDDIILNLFYKWLKQLICIQT